MNEIRICAQCGQEKSADDFSKSYKTLCKDCVAKNEKEKRNIKKLAVETFHFHQGVNLLDSEDDIVRFTPLPRLYISAFALQGLLSSGRIDNSADFIAKKAVEYADALLNELKKSTDGAN